MYNCYKMAIRKMYSYQMKDMLFVSSVKKVSLRFVLYGVLFLVAVFVCYIPNMLPGKKHSIHHHNRRFPMDLKYILFTDQPRPKQLSSYFDREPKFPEGQQGFIKQRCPFINCYVTYNKSLLNHEWYFDAIVFDIRDLTNKFLEELNYTRSTHQRYIFKAFEPADKNPICNPILDKFFNWTWSYKLDSDIPHPFLNIYDSNNTLVGPKRGMNWPTNMKRTDKNKSKLKSKSKAVAWIVGRCKTKSMHKDFVEELLNELGGYNYTLDIYGPCGNKDCPNGLIYKCYKMIEKSYFFQLVLEDSNADDYITERLEKVLNHKTVPIVSGSATYKDFLPPGTYINSQSFDIKKLVAIIDYLIKNPKMYEMFFDWTNHFYYSVRPRNYICDLCTKLNTNSEGHMVYKKLREWWNPEYQDVCDRMSLYNMFAEGKDLL